MDKPSTVLHREFVDKLQNLINGSHLPAFVLVPVVRDALDQLIRLEDQQFQRDAAEWNAERQKEAKTGVNADGRQKDK